MPCFQLEVFGSPNDMVANQPNIVEIDDTLVRPWALQSVLALLTARVDLVARVILQLGVVTHCPFLT
jgi:hypothetical protein